jgi:uncharacterized protein YcaQ
MSTTSISKLTFRRFLLGAQGLWPQRRFPTAEAALNQIQALQLDPLVMVARSQDIAMYGRVLDYKPGHLYQTAYDQRKAFDYGGWLAMYPMQEFPYWRAIMPRVESYSRLRLFKKKFPKAMQEVQQILRENGAMSNRDFQGEGLKYWSYRGRKDTSVALFYSWLLGDVMITTRKGFDRVYDLRERVLPAEHDHVVEISAAEDFFARKQIAFLGMMREKQFRTLWSNSIDRKISPQEEKQKLAEMLERGITARFQVEGFKEAWITLAENLQHLADLESGRIPEVWKSTSPTTLDEVTLLAPLEIVSARGRAKHVFDFEYVWEVYKPAHQRRWGYYTLPILYGDDLVARLDPKLDRKTNTLHILGFWLEDDAPRDGDFAIALAKGLVRFAEMIGAVKIDVNGIKPIKLKAEIKKLLNKVSPIVIPKE